MTYRAVCAAILSFLFAGRLLAQSTTQPTQPPTAQTTADFPDEPAGSGEKIGYVLGHIGSSSTSDVRAVFGDVEGGFRVTKSVWLFGTYGMYRNLKPSDNQSYVDLAASQMAQRGIDVTGQAREPARYVLGGLRVSVPTSFHIFPYALAAAGWAQSTPSAKFTYVTGSPTVSGGKAAAGQDATDDVLSTGVFVGDPWNALIVRVGAGVTIPVSRLFFVDAGYSRSRVFAPSTFDVNGITVGLAFRF
jgi:opacity protein-like surface antigen